MKTQYVARFSARTLKTGIHSPACSVVAGGDTRHFVCIPVEAETAAAAARIIADAEEFDARGIALPKICNCAK
jgi:hypothetical protein